MQDEFPDEDSESMNEYDESDKNMEHSAFRAFKSDKLVKKEAPASVE